MAAHTVAGEAAEAEVEDDPKSSGLCFCDFPCYGPYCCGGPWQRIADGDDCQAHYYTLVLAAELGIPQPF